jgi:predicted nuclease of predicted toxin-antitoxin system
MKILVDENIPKLTVAELISLGHDVCDLRGTDLEGADDEELWQIAQSEKRLLISTDKGFAHRRFEQHAGILLVILHRPNRIVIHERVLRAVKQSQEGEWPNQLVIMRDAVQSLWRAS